MSDILTEFEQFLAPLDSAIAITYKEKIQQTIFQLYENYREKSYSAPTATIKFNETMNLGTKSVLGFISKKYRKDILEYWSETGLVLYIHTQLKIMSQTEIDQKIAQYATGE